VNITREPVLSGMTLELYAQAVSNQLLDSFTITDQQAVQLGPYDAVRLIIEADFSDVLVQEAIYLVKNENTMYIITFATGTEEFEARFPDFEQSAQTLVIQP
jgi:hypothetical protein